MPGCCCDNTQRCTSRGPVILAMGKTKSSRRWLKEHFDDAYVKQAQVEGLRSRAAYKLRELQEKYQLIKPGKVIVDLGAAPGGWLQEAAKWMRRGDRLDGQLIGLDLLPIEPLPDVTFIQGDFTENQPLAELESLLAGSKVDLVMSDMAPNISGMNAVDQPRAMYLVELALDFAQNHLSSGGDFLAKVFQGEGFDDLLRALRSGFAKVRVEKPKASRPRSREVYLLAQGFRNGSG